MLGEIDPDTTHLPGVSMRVVPLMPVHSAHTGQQLHDTMASMTVGAASGGDRHGDANVTTSSAVRALVALTRANERLACAIASRLGIGGHELNALIHLSESLRLTPGDFAKKLQLPSPSITSLIDRLEAAELVRRTRDESVDRRKVWVVLTDAGEIAVRWCHLQWRIAFDAFDVGRLSTTVEDLNALSYSVMGQAAVVSDPRGCPVAGSQLLDSRPER